MRRQAGFSLLEVMIAGVVTALGLAGTAALLTFSLAQTSAARDVTIAGQLARQLSETIRLTPAAEDSYFGPPAASPPACEGAANCTPAEFAAASLARWAARVTRTLPGGSGLACRDATPEDGTAAAPACDGAGPLVVKLFWTDPGADSLPRRFALQVPGT